MFSVNYILMVNNNRVVWTYWAGGPMSSARAEAYEYIINKHPTCDVKLVSEETFKQYQIESSPIPKEFYLLSSTQQSDYVRSYLMQHYGGVYSDIKPYDFDFAAILTLLYEDENCWGIGYSYRERELKSLKTYHNINDFKNGDRYIGGGCFAYKSNTDFTKKWLEVNNLMLKNNSIKLLKQPGTYHPRAIPRGIFRQDSSDLNVYPTGYPFGWGSFIGNYQLAQKEYLDHFKPILARVDFPPEQYR